VSVVTWVELAALGLAVWATVLSIPRPPRLKWERLFKVGLAILTAGEVERELGTADAAARKEWSRRVLGSIPWNPAGRYAQEKLAEARLEAVPVPALEGERALVEALARLPDPAARYARMYVQDDRAEEELLGDPADLGQDHDPARLLGPGAGWDEVAAWSTGLQEVLSRRLAAVVMVLDGLSAPLAQELGAAVPGLRCLVLPEGSQVEPAFDAIEERLEQDADRVILVAGGVGIQRSLRALAEGAGLRDRTLAVLSLGGQVRSPEMLHWLDEHFTHEALDTELRRTVPYLSIVDVDPARPLDRDWAEQRFPVPAPTVSGRVPVEIVDLGPLHLAGIHPRVLARGLLLLLALRLAA